MRAESSKRLCALMTRAACGCRVGGCSGHLAASGSCSDFPGVNHEGRQACTDNFLVNLEFPLCARLSFLNV